MWTLDSNFNEFIATLIWLLPLLVNVLLAFIFAGITKYSEKEEFKKGNWAVALVSGGKFLGVSIIMFVSGITKESIPDTILWGTIGFGLMMVGYFVFNLITPFDNDKEIQDKNPAIAILSFTISIVIALNVALAIS